MSPHDIQLQTTRRADDSLDVESRYAQTPPGSPISYLSHTSSVRSSAPLYVQSAHGTEFPPADVKYDAYSGTGSSSMSEKESKRTVNVGRIRGAILLLLFCFANFVE